MRTQVLYIENNESDAEAFRIVLSNFEDVELRICNTFAELVSIDLDLFNAIICNASLPDADYVKLKIHLSSYPNTQFVSAESIDGEPIWLKPITKENLQVLCCFKRVTNLDYIDSLALGDLSYEYGMLETAYKILPERLEEILASKSNLSALKRAVHRTKTSYRVCGIDSTLLDEIAEMDEYTFNENSRVCQIVKYITTTITKAIRELEILISKNKVTV